MIVIEKKLKKLFDYQRYEKNKDLQHIINDVENRFPEEVMINDYELSFVAGGKNVDVKKDKEDTCGK